MQRCHLITLVTLLALTLGGLFAAPARLQAQAGPTIIYVNDDATGANDGSSWTDAYPSLADALASAPSPSEIWVAAGTYTPTSGTDRAATFQLKENVAIYGGFASGETQLAARDWAANETILSGDIGNENDASDNSYHVVTGANNAILDGFTISGGNADEEVHPDNGGGGMYNDYSSPTLINITFSGNSADNIGGGMFNFNSNPTLTNVTFSSNAATHTGGGMANFSSSPALTNVAFSGNEAGLGSNEASFGGGMVNLYYSSPTLTNVTFNANKAERGGGMYNDNTAPTIRNSILWSNSGGEISGDAATVSHSIVQGGYEGTGNKNENPNFVSSTDLHLQPGSPAIDAGDSSLVPTGVTTDLDGNSRVVGANVDMGAYEVQPLAPTLDGTPPAGTYNTLYNDFSFGVTGIPAPTLSVSGGSLPDGLSLNGATLSGTPGQAGTFSFTLLAENSVGQASLAVSLEINRANQTISFDAISDHTYGDGPLTLNAKATSDLPVSFGSSTTGVCTVNGSDLTILTVGSCTLTASQTGNTNYNPAPGVPQSFTIDPAQLTVAADNTTKVYGDANPPFTATYSGFKNGETLASSGVTGAPTLTTTATAATNVGTSPITAVQGSLASSNYSFTFVPGMLAVTKAPLTAAVDPASRQYGDPNPAFDVTLSGFVNGDTSDDLSGAPICTTAANASSPAGSYAITCDLSDMSAANYSLPASASGTLTITPVNNAPVVQDDSYTAREDKSLNVSKANGVLANDSGQNPTNTLTALLVADVAHGTLMLKDNGSFSYTPEADYYGRDSFTYQARNSSGATSTPATVTINITPVNDAPAFTRGSNVSVAEDSGAYSAAWATNISPGAANESDQSLAFKVTKNSRPNLFSAQPTITADGRLSFTPALNANGSATITVALTDNGGRAGGGKDSAATQTFTIAITPANDPPTIIAVLGDSCGGDFSGRILLIVGDIDSPDSRLTLSGSSSNTSVVSNHNIKFSGGGFVRTVTISAAARDNVDEATVTITLSDGSDSTTTTITVIVGTNQDDTLTGSAGADLIFAGAGNDTVNAGAGNDLVCGGDGNDTLYGGDDKDVIEAGNGNDMLYGEDDNDVLRGGNGNDQLYGGGDGDVLTGGAGADLFSGGAGFDIPTDFSRPKGDTKDSTTP